MRGAGRKGTPEGSDNPRRLTRFCSCATCALGSLLVLTGCETSFTGKLWRSSEFTHFAEPAPEPHVALYVAPAGSDVLVQYDEARENKDSVQRRAYFLGRNVQRVAEHKKPRFVNPRVASGLLPIPLSDAQISINSSPTSPRANYNKDQREVSLSGIDGLDGPHPLPVYQNNSGNVARIALTPLAVTGDAMVVCAVVGVVAACAYVGAGAHCAH